MVWPPAILTVITLRSKAANFFDQSGDVVLNDPPCDNAVHRSVSTQGIRPTPHAAYNFTSSRRIVFRKRGLR